MRRSLGTVLVANAALAGVLGGLWAFMKAAGAEADYCDGQNCTSGWFGAVAFLALAVITGLVGWSFLRRGEEGRRSRY